jgi:hypothetical protein
MATAIPSLETLDAFMNAEKDIVNADFQNGRWEDTHIQAEKIMKWPLALAETGEILPGASLGITTHLTRRDMPIFRIQVFCPIALARLDHADEIHPNNLSDVMAGIVPAFVDGPHYHSWPLNRRFFSPNQVIELKNATLFTSGAASFDAALRWFCDENRINQPPNHHRIELLGPDRLL